MDIVLSITALIIIALAVKMLSEFVDIDDKTNHE